MKERCVNNEIEQNQTTTQTLSRQDLLNKIFPDKKLPIENLLHGIYTGELPKDKRFRCLYRGGSFEYFDPKDIVTDKDISFYSMVEVNNEIVALSKLLKDKEDKEENKFWVSFLAVDRIYEKKGYGTKLIEEIFDFTKKNNYSLIFTPFSREGRKRMKNVVKRCAKKNSVTVCYHDDES